MWHRLSRTGAGFTVAGFGLALGIAIFDWKGIDMPDLLFIPLLALAAGVAVIGLIMIAVSYMSPASTRSESGIAMFRGKVTSYGQRGGQTAGIIANLGPLQRTLKNVDIKSMVARLSAFQGTKVGILCLMGNTEAHRFALEMKDLLERAGWLVDDVIHAALKGVPTGVIVRSSGTGIDDMNPAMRDLGQCLLDFGFEASAEVNPERDQLEILVGATRQ